MIKKTLISAIAVVMMFGTILVATQTVGFSGGVTGHLWFGTVWSEWNRAPASNNNVVVFAKGQTTEKDYANDWSDARATANRKPSGNKAYWDYY